MSQPQPTNPFYVALLPIGALFALTACAYVVMTMRGLDPQRAEPTGAIALLAQHGVWIMGGELATLAILTVAAIASDDFWARRFAHTQAQRRETGPLP